MESAPLWTRCAGPAGAYAGIYPPPTEPAPEPPARPTMRLTPIAVTPETPKEPTTAYACLREGRTATAEGDLRTALTWFDRAIARDPTMGIAHFCRALCLLEQGRDEEAAQSLDIALTAAPKDSAARIQLARLYATNGQGTMAMKLLSTALEATPELAQKIGEDTNFASLRDHPEFLAMLGAI